MLEIIQTSKFKKEFQLMVKRGNNMELFSDAISLLIEQKPLPKNYEKHPLRGKYTGYIDIHIAPDWILIYKVQGNTLVLARTGTHSDLF